jgi:hypothetical protein
MKNINYTNLTESISKDFPSYLSTSYYEHNDSKIIFSFFSGFMSYIISIINSENDPLSNKEVNRAFHLLNHMIECGDYLENLATVEGIESLVQEKKSKEVALELLDKKGKKILKEVLEYTGV